MKTLLLCRPLFPLLVEKERLAHVEQCLVAPSLLQQCWPNTSPKEITGESVLDRKQASSTNNVRLPPRHTPLWKQHVWVALAIVTSHATTCDSLMRQEGGHPHTLPQGRCIQAQATNEARQENSSPGAKEKQFTRK